ncbi:MAG: tetratricopeptide repeat protein [Thermoanaerobaculia bacterium]
MKFVKRPTLGRSSFLLSALCFLLCFLLSSCITWTPHSRSTSASAVTIHDMPMQKWGIESCGAGSLSTVLRHYGDPTTMQQWDAELPKTRGGVMTIDMLIAARQKGFDARLVTGNRAVVEEELRAGRPVILMLQVIDSPGKSYDFFHYVVADGIDPERSLIRTQFGDGQARWVTFDRLDKAWSGGAHTAILIHPRDAVEDSLRAAVVLEDQGKYDEAATKYRDILAQHPGSVVAWTNLGNAESHLGHTEAAETAFRKAIELDPQSSDALNNLAWLLYQQKRYDEAELLARRAVAHTAQDTYLVLDTLARILAARGACAEAVATFRQAIDAVPASRTSARTDLENGLAEAQRTCHN